MARSVLGILTILAVMLGWAALVWSTHARADKHEDGWTREQMRECEIRLAAAYASNPDRFPSSAAIYAKRECKKLREAQ